MDISEKWVPGRGNGQCKGPEVEACVECVEYGKEASGTRKE